MDYAVSAVTDTSPTTIGGDPLSGSFTLTNTGSSDGSADVEWKVYVSLGNTVVGTDDQLVDMSSTEPALTAGESVVVNFSGDWPTAAGTYYLIAEAEASLDITNTANNEDASTGITLTDMPPADVDYIVDPRQHHHDG